MNFIDNWIEWPLRDILLQRPLAATEPLVITEEHRQDPNVRSLTEAVKNALAFIESGGNFNAWNGLNFFPEETLNDIENLSWITYAVNDSGIMFLFIASQLIGYIPNAFCQWASSSWGAMIRKISFVKTDSTWEIIDPKAILATAPPEGSGKFELSLDSALDEQSRGRALPDSLDPNWQRKDWE